MMFRLFISSLFLCYLSLHASPCFAQAEKTEGEHTLYMGSDARTYILHTPATHAGHCPLVLVLHGGGGAAQTMHDLTGFDRVADANGFVVAYPQGLGKVWNDGGSDLTEGKHPRDDVAFMRELVKDVGRQIPIDEKQVFACGFSNGGCLAARLVLEAHDLVCAVAMVSSGLYERVATSHPNPNPAPVLFIEGVNDPCYLYNGGMSKGPNFGGMFRGTEHGRILSTEDAIAFWCKVNGCGDKPEIAKVPHVTADNTSTTYKRWAGKQGNDVVAYIVDGGGHCWPGGAQYFPVNVIGKTTYDFSASQAIWRFFQRHASVPH